MEIINYKKEWDISLTVLQYNTNKLMIITSVLLISWTLVRFWSRHQFKYLKVTSYDLYKQIEPGGRCLIKQGGEIPCKDSWVNYKIWSRLINRNMMNINKNQFNRFIRVHQVLNIEGEPQAFLLISDTLQYQVLNASSTGDLMITYKLH